MNRIAKHLKPGLLNINGCYSRVEWALRIENQQVRTKWKC